MQNQRPVHKQCAECPQQQQQLESNKVEIADLQRQLRIAERIADLNLELEKQLQLAVQERDDLEKLSARQQRNILELEDQSPRNSRSNSPQAQAAAPLSKKLRPKKPKSDSDDRLAEALSQLKALSLGQVLPIDPGSLQQQAAAPLSKQTSKKPPDLALAAPRDLICESGGILYIKAEPSAPSAPTYPDLAPKVEEVICQSLYCFHWLCCFLLLSPAVLLFAALTGCATFCCSHRLCCFLLLSLAVLLFAAVLRQ